ncbi:MAG: chemotaxis protein CheW [Spirochaetia bacterium]|nr:chemotaxis protein CheW [Spirochaetia bacterium]
MQLVTWYVGEHLFGIDVRQCREVVAGVRITPVAHAPSYLHGIANLRGDVVTVLDQRILLGHASGETPETSVIVRLKGEKQNLAIRADRVSDVMDVTSDHIEGTPATATETEARFIAGAANTAAGLIVILNVDAVMKYSPGKTSGSIPKAAVA